jgi:hypothetical protein
MLYSYIIKFKEYKIHGEIFRAFDKNGKFLIPVMVKVIAELTRGSIKILSMLREQVSDDVIFMQRYFV